MIEKYLDPYDLKARVVPGLIVVFPIIIASLYVAPILNDWRVFTASGICGFAMIYAIGQCARALGERAEPKLWKSWGGPPSTRFLRHRDTFFGDSLKQPIYENLRAEFGSVLLSADEEGLNPAMADKAIEDGFRRVREYLRARNPNGIWHSHNIEYGFTRNLYGCRIIWSAIALLSAAAVAIYARRTGGNPLNPAFVMDCIALVASWIVGWNVLPGALRRVADGYAETAWLAFLRLSEESRKGIPPLVISGGAR